MLIDYFLMLPRKHYPIDGCAILVKDAFNILYDVHDLPRYNNKFITVDEAGKIIKQEKDILAQIEHPEHGCMIAGKQGEKWHCGIYTTEQSPNYVIHTFGQKIKIETLNQFKSRFNSIEFYKYVSHH